VKKTRNKGAVIEASADAKRYAQAVLEVLAGIRGPSDAAEALSTSLPNYYKLETKALEGLVSALEPRERGRKGLSDEDRIRTIEKERDALRREVERMRSLVRLAQRTVGMPQSTQAGENKDKKGRKSRRTNRAKRILARLGGDKRAEIPEADPASPGDGVRQAEGSLRESRG
jgi:hypothetical protein